MNKTTNYQKIVFLFCFLLHYSYICRGFYIMVCSILHKNRDKHLILLKRIFFKYNV